MKKKKNDFSQCNTAAAENIFSTAIFSTMKN